MNYQNNSNKNYVDRYNSFVIAKRLFIAIKLFWLKNFQVENIPWKEFATSLPVWAIIVAHVTENWGWYTLLTQLPTYLKTVLDFNLQEVCQYVFCQNVMAL